MEDALQLETAGPPGAGCPGYQKVALLGEISFESGEKTLSKVP